MPLTPIRVRGKRKRPTAATASDLDLKQARRSAAHQELAKKRLHRPVKRSLLELQLPLEVMELVFLYSENLNFPRASPAIGRLLSGRHTLVSTIIAAFGPTWDITFGLPGGVDEITRGVNLQAQHARSVGEVDYCSALLGSPSFQSEVLACRWATVDMILDAQTQWARMHAKGRPFARIPKPGPVDGDHVTHFDAHACFEQDLVEVTSACMFSKLGRKRLFLGYVDVHPATLIPDRLIMGPWDEEMVRRLVWLRRGGALLQESQTWELRLLGLKNVFANPAAAPPPLLSHLILWLFLPADFFRGFDYNAGLATLEELPDSLWPAQVLGDTLDMIIKWQEETPPEKQPRQHVRRLMSVIEELLPS